jgi:Ca2+:H+ antiporter
MDMRKLIHSIANYPLSILLIAIPLALLAEFGNWNAAWVFILSAVAVIPLAGYIGKSTEVLAFYTGPKIGGLLNATLGNAAELIITLVAIRAGLLELVKASITGSIIGNLLLVLGFAIFAGGLKNGLQVFDRRQSGSHVILLTLSILALVIPSFFSHSIGPDGSPQVESLSLSVAGVMIVLYALGLVFTLRTVHSPMTFPSAGEEEQSHWSKLKALIILAIATVGIVWLSELLVGAVDHVVETLGISQFFLGIILIPIVGNVAEHLVAVQVALRNKMDLSVEIALSSSLQIALFVAPLLVFISLAMGHPLTLIFNQFELLALGAGVLVAALVSADGESNWLEGAALLAVYAILGIAFFLMPV